MFHDLRFALRLIRRQPAFSALVVGTLTVGMAASTAIFAICDRVLLKPLPYPESERILSLGQNGFSIDNGHLAVSRSLRALPAFSAVGLFTTGGLNIGAEPQPARVRASAVSAGFFDAMGVTPQMGRTIDAAEFQAASPVIVISARVWRREFQADPAIVGRTIRVNSQSFNVIGVMPASFTYPEDSDAWMAEGAENLGGSAYAPYTIARLSPGTSVASAEQALQALEEAQQLKRDPASTPHASRPTLRSVREELALPARPTLLFLGGVVGLLLLAMCANVAGLLLSRLRGRARELAVRSALGARPARLARQLAIECLVLSSLGAIGGLTLAIWTMRAFVAAAPAFITDIDLISIDWRLFAIGGGVALVCGLLFALGPTASAMRGRASGSLRDARTSTAGGAVFSHTLLVGQIAVALVLLTGASAAVAVVVRLMDVDLGFHNQKAAVFEVMLPPAKYKNETAAAFVDRLETELRSAPGILRVGTTRMAPGSTALGLGVRISDADGPPPAQNTTESSASLLSANKDYFQAMGIKLLAGRSFLDTDRAGAPPVAILNETAARIIWGNPASAIGRRLRTATSTRKAIEAEVVGVVADVRLRGVSRTVGRQLYLPMAQDPPYGSVTVAIEAAGDPAAVLPAARAALARVDADLPPYHVVLLRDLTAEYLATERTTLALTGAFALIALALCAIGLYGALSQTVARRTREIGIRVALGANRARLRWTIVSTSLRVAIAGVLIGGLASGAAARAIARYVPALDAPSTVAVVIDAVVLVVVAGLAAWLPAHRASAVDPVVALRAE